LLVQTRVNHSTKRRSHDETRDRYRCFATNRCARMADLAVADVALMSASSPSSRKLPTFRIAQHPHRAVTPAPLVHQHLAFE